MCVYLNDEPVQLVSHCGDHHLGGVRGQVGLIEVLPVDFFVNEFEDDDYDDDVYEPVPVINPNAVPRFASELSLIAEGGLTELMFELSDLPRRTLHGRELAGAIREAEWR